MSTNKVPTQHHVRAQLDSDDMPELVSDQTLQSLWDTEQDNVLRDIATNADVLKDTIRRLVVQVGCLDD